MAKNLLQGQNISKAYGLKSLFDSATFSINEGEHVGVIGHNGAGKSTLFKIILKAEDLDDGFLVQSKNLKISSLEQEFTCPKAITVKQFVESEDFPFWMVDTHAEELGLSHYDLERPIEVLSGGLQMRARLLKVLSEAPDLLLLDEPTNYLDLETLLILEKFLQTFTGAIMLITHDREFLRRTTDHILEIELGQMTKFNGHIDDYFEQKAQLSEILQKSALNQSKKREQIENFINRFGAKASKAKQAQSKLKTLNKLEKIEIKNLPSKAKIKLPEPIKTGKLVAEVKDSNIGYGENIILKQVNIQLNIRDKCAVVGVNGAGKSTLLKVLSQKLKPLCGEIYLGHNVNFAYYGQHVYEELNLNFKILDELQKDAHPDVHRQGILDIAGALLFSGDDLQKKIKVLSGGEKARVCLAKVLLKRVPFLILDEPTNHLDFDTVEALTQALSLFKGTIIFVSHDRGFVKRVGTKIIEIKNGEVFNYPGTYEEYIWSLQNSDRDNLENPKIEKAIRTRSGSFNKKEDKAIRIKLRELKKECSSLEKSLEKTESQIVSKNKEILEEGCDYLSLSKQIEDLQTKKATLESSWEKASEQLEQLN